MPEAQQQVLAAPDAVPALANNGQAAAAMTLIAALAPDAQREVLAVPDAVPALANNGQAAAAMTLIAALAPERQTQTQTMQPNY